MDHDRIRTEDTVNRYLREELSANEAEAFEQHYLACQQCLNEIADTQVLREGLLALADSGYLEQPADGGRAWIPAWAAAASLLLAISLVTNGVLLGTRSDRPAGPDSAELFNLVTVRDASGEPVNEVEPAVATATVVLIVDSGRLDDPGPYAVTVVPEGSPADRVRLESLTAGADGRIAVVVPVAMLSAGIYRLDVSEHQASAVLNSARFVWTQ